MQRLSAHLPAWIAAVAASAVALLSAAGPAVAAGVRVHRGDTLTALSQRYGTTLSALAAVNGLANLNLIYAGELLQLPAAGGAQPASGVAGGGTTARGGPAASGTASAGTVTVTRGETLSAVAARYETTVGALARANGITNPDLIIAGVRLLVPATTAPAQAAQPTGSAGSPAAGTGTVSQAPSASVNASGATSGVASGAAPAAPTTSASSPLPAVLLANPARLALRPYFQQAAATYGVPLGLLEAMCWWESGWQTTVISVTGAIGLCQVEPSTAAFVNTFLSPAAPLNLSIPSGNIALGAAYLAYLLRQTGGSQSQALAAYFQGLISVQRNGLLPQTRQYVAGILAYESDFAAAG